jgi:hypothetical protein
MLNLSPNLQHFLENEEEILDFKRISANELEIDGKIHILTSYECDNCSGAGKHLYGSLKGHCFTDDDISKDPDFFDDMREGKYDVTCNSCEGNGFFMIFADNKDNKEFIEKIENDAIADAEYAAEVRAERRALGGDY